MMMMMMLMVVVVVVKNSVGERPRWWWWWWWWLWWSSLWGSRQGPHQQVGWGTRLMGERPRWWWCRCWWWWWWCWRSLWGSGHVPKMRLWLMDEYGGHDRDDERKIKGQLGKYSVEILGARWMFESLITLERQLHCCAITKKYKRMQFVSFPFQCSPIVHLEFYFHSYLFLHLPK